MRFLRRKRPAQPQWPHMERRLPENAERRVIEEMRQRAEVAEQAERARMLSDDTEARIAQVQAAVRTMRARRQN